MLCEANDPGFTAWFVFEKADHPELRGVWCCARRTCAAARFLKGVGNDESHDSLQLPLSVAVSKNARIMITKCCLLLGTVCFHAAAMAGEGGVIKGRVPLEGSAVPIAVEKYSGKISGKVASPPRPIAAVWLEAPNLHAPSDAKPIAVEQRGYQFGNWLVVVPVGARVTFPNMDADYHNVFSLSKAKRFDLGRYKPEEKPSPVVTFDKPGVVLSSLFY